MNVLDQIKETVTQNPVVVFMKGTPGQPQCGFSAQTIRCLQSVGAPLVAVNVLADPEVRQGIKDFTGWPTIPQVFVRGEFIGGCDIVTEMFENGDLSKLINAAS